MEKMDDLIDMPNLEDKPELTSDVSSSTNRTSNRHVNKVSIMKGAGKNTYEESDIDVDDDCDDEQNWDEEEEEEYENNGIAPMNALCLFCQETLSSPCSIFSHMEVEHQFSMKSMACHWTFDQLMYIKFVNYIRREKPKPVVALGIKPMDLKKEEYLKPLISNDPLLMFDVEEFYDYTEDVGSEEESCNVASLQATCDELREVVHRQRDALRRMMEETHGGRELKVAKTVSDIEAEEDEGYFNSYAYFDIHHEMLSDKVRTEAYRDAILKNKSLFSGKHVLDLGCGTAILSMFAASAGANVVAVDMSEVIFHAMQIVKENGLEDSIDLRKGRLEDTNFSHKFDVIVSEWMGYFLLFEGMLDSVIYARNHYLATNGYLLPNRCTLHLVGGEDMEAYKKFVSFWGDVYGFKMDCMINESIKEASTEVIKNQNIFTSSCQIRDFDIMTVTPEDTEFTQEFVLTAERDAALTCFVGYFDTYFDLPSPVNFSTGPLSESTHWKQTIFYLPQLRQMKKGEEIKGVISVKRKKREIRSLDVTITFENKKYNYFVE